MSILILLVLGLVTLYTLMRSKKFANPIFLFCGLWFVVVLFASIKLYGMLDYSESILTIIFIGVLSFCLGGLLAKRFAPQKIKKEAENNSDNNRIIVNWSMANLFLAVSFICMSVLMVVSCYYLMTGHSFADIHGMYNDYGDYGKLLPEFISSIITWIAVPCLYGAIFIALSLMFVNKRTRRERKYIFFVALTAIMYVFGSASRILMATIVIIIFMLFQCFNKQFSKKQKRALLLLIACACLIILFFLVVRKGTRKINTVYAYLSIPVPIFAHWKEWFDAAGSNLFGGATFYGILSWINFFTSKIGLELPVVMTAREYITATQDTWLVLFNSGYVYNAFCSIFYYFYMDFGLFGVILFDFIFGYVSYKLYHNIFVLKKYQLLPYYLLIVQCIIFSFVRWQAGTQGFIVELVVILCSIPRKKICNTKKIVHQKMVTEKNE